MLKAPVVVIVVGSCRTTVATSKRQHGSRVHIAGDGDGHALDVGPALDVSLAERRRDEEGEDRVSATIGVSKLQTVGRDLRLYMGLTRAELDKLLDISFLII